MNRIQYILLKLNKIDLRNIVLRINPDIIGLTETWLNCNKNEFESEFNLEGYTMLNKDRKNKSILD